MDVLEGVCVCSKMLLLLPRLAHHARLIQVHCYRQSVVTTDCHLAATMYAVQKDSSKLWSLCVQNIITTGAFRATIAMVEYHQATLDLVQAAAEVSYSTLLHPMFDFCSLLQLNNCCKLQQHEFKLLTRHKVRCCLTMTCSSMHSRQHAPRQMTCKPWHANQYLLLLQSTGWWCRQQECIDHPARKGQQPEGQG